jgi:hypothetical protein
VKVGRSALDEDAIRHIEELNPFIEFDWTRILKGQGAPPSEPRPPLEAREARRQRPQGRGAEPPRPHESEPAPAVEFADFREALDSPELGSETAPAADLTPTADQLHVDPVSPGTPAEARLGAEGVLRLRARHAEILARISERISEPVRREELKTRADRLNPDMWVTGDEVTQGLEQYESVLASLKEVVGRKRRRRRRGKRQDRPAPAGQNAAASGVDPAEASGAALESPAEGDQRGDGDDEWEEDGEDPGSGSL